MNNPQMRQPTPQQMVAIVVFEAVIADMLVATEQLKAILGPHFEATEMQGAMEHVSGVYNRVRAQWASGLVIAEPEDVAALVRP
jgi:hypothetical protein